MRISAETIEQKLNEVPENIREQVTSEEVADTLTKIAQANGLHIDQISILEEETLYAMLGLEDASQFAKKLQERIGLDEGKAASLAYQINDRVFLKIRESLMNNEPRESTPAPIEEEPVQKEMPTEVPQEETPGDKDDILAEIENPEPTMHPISAADQTIAGAAQSKEVVEANEALAHKFIGGKLNETVNIPVQKTVSTPPPQPPKPKSYSVDPYREPIA